MDRTVRVWEVSGGRHVRELAGHDWRTYAVAVTPDGKAVVSSGADGCVRVQSLEGKPLRRILVDGPAAGKEPIHVIALGLTPDGKKAATWRWGPRRAGRKGGATAGAMKTPFTCGSWRPARSGGPSRAAPLRPTGFSGWPARATAAPWRRRAATARSNSGTL